MSDDIEGQQIGVSRRTVAKAMAWTVPAIALAVPAPAMAASPTGCQRFAYAWGECYSGPGQILPGSQVPDPSNLTCCPSNPTWAGMLDSGCVVVSSGTRNGNLWVRLMVSCDGCYLVSPGTFYSTNGVDCTVESSTVQGGGFYEWFEFEFTSGKVPVYFTAYVNCGGDECDVKPPEIKVV